MDEQQPYKQRQSGRKILLIDNDLTISGASLMLFGLAEHLISEGFAVDVGAVRCSDGALRRRYEALGAALPEQLNATDYSLCIANTIFSAQLVAAIAPQVKTIWWIHEADNGLEVALGEPALYLNAFSAAHKVVFPVARLRDAIYQSFLYQLPPEKCAIVANGIERPEQTLPMPGNGHLRIVALATIDLRKRQDDILAALEKLGDPNIELILVGQKNWLSEAGEQALARDRQRGSQRYQLLGALDHDAALRWLASADLLVHPASVETQPLAPIEAALLGIPMILADLDIYQGTWRHGENCLMHGVADVELLAELIAVLKRNPPLGKRLAARAKITAEQFSRRAFRHRFDQVISELLD